MSAVDDSVRWLRESLGRRDTKAVRAAVNALLEAGRREALSRTQRFDSAEAEILNAELERRQEARRPTSALRKALAVAEGDRLRVAAGLAAITETPRPKPGGFTIAGRVKGGQMPSNATVIFVSATGEEIDGTPALAVSADGSFAEALGADATAALAKRLARAKGAMLAFKIGKRIVATAPRPVVVTPGTFFQANFTAPPTR